MLISASLIEKIYNFIQKALNRHSVVLINSNNAISRSVIWWSLFLMRKFKWSMTKSLQFLYLKWPYLQISASILYQLKLYDQIRESKYFISADWDEIDLEGEFHDEEVLLSNTYLNIINNMPTDNKSKFPPTVEDIQESPRNTQPKIKWWDRETSKSLVTVIPENYKAQPKMKFVNLGDYDLISNTNWIYEKSVPISEDESEDLSSFIGNLNSVKPIGKKDSNYPQYLTSGLRSPMTLFK